MQDDCSGTAIPGVSNGYVVGCIRNWGITPIVREGDVSEFASDCGKVVVRQRQDDQLTGYTISFESSVRSVELEALVTGKDLIADDGTNIGTYGVGGNVGCNNPIQDPRFIVEAFYRLNTCITDANHVRVVLPLAQFKVTELDKEGTITFFRYTAETSSSLATALADGPYADFPDAVSDFLAARDDSEYTTGFDFEETISISGACGAIEVPEPVPPISVDFATSRTGGGGLNITGAGFTSADSSSILYPDGSTNADAIVSVVDDTHLLVTYGSHGFATVRQVGFIVNGDPVGPFTINPTYLGTLTEAAGIAAGSFTVTDAHSGGNIICFNGPNDLIQLVITTTGNIDHTYPCTGMEWSSDGNHVTITDAALSGLTVIGYFFKIQGGLLVGPAKSGLSITLA